MATLQEARDTVARLYKELQRRRPRVKRYSDYYDGRHPLQFATKAFRSYWGGLFDEFADNWCQVVVDSKTERLQVVGVRVGQEADPETWRVFQANGFEADSGLAFVDSLAESRSFGLVWGNPDDESTPDVTFEAASEAIIGYEPGSRRRRRAALKTWCDDDEGIEYATLFLPSAVWKFSRPRSALLQYAADQPGYGTTPAGIAIPVTSVLAGAEWELRDTADTGDRSNPQSNPMRVVPMVELPNRSRLAKEPVSEIRNVIPLQDSVNLIWSHLLTASDYAAFPQRVIMGMDAPKRPIRNEAGEITGHEPADLSKFAVDRVVWLENPEAKIGEWQAADLENYTKVIEVAVGHIAAQTRTPQHYLIGKMANLSAEALKAAETGLVSSVREKQLYLGEAIKEMARLVALAQGDEAKAVEVSRGAVMWKDPESRSDAEKASSLVQLKGINVPDEMLWTLYGFTPDQIRDMKAMQSQQAQRVGLTDLAAFLNGPQGPQENGQPQPVQG